MEDPKVKVVQNDQPKSLYNFQIQTNKMVMANLSGIAWYCQGLQNNKISYLTK